MYTYQRRLYLRDTDATGRLFFSKQFEIALEAFEEFLASKEFSLREMVDQKKIAFPIRHAKGDFLSPLLLGDQLEVKLTLTSIGSSSFTCTSMFFRKGVPVGSVELVHVAIDPQKGIKIELPKALIELLKV